MTEELNQAKYLLSVSNNAVEDSVRQEITSYVENSNKTMCDVLFAQIILAVIDSVKDGIYTLEMAKTVVQTEFIELGLSSACGDYTIFSDLINLVINSCEYTNLRADNFIYLYKSFISLADNLDFDYKSNIYYAILRHMVQSNCILNDKELTEKIVSYLDSIDQSNVEEVFSKVVTTVLNNAK